MARDVMILMRANPLQRRTASIEQLKMVCPHQKNYAQSPVKDRYIGNFKHMSFICCYLRAQISVNFQSPMAPVMDFHPHQEGGGTKCM